MKTKSQQKPTLMEVCYKKPDGVSTRVLGTDLDWAVMEYQSDKTRMVVLRENKQVAEFPTENLVWARGQHK